MAEYVVYVNVDQLRMGTGQSVTTTFERCGFKRALRREEGTLPLTPLLFVGHSSFGETQLARHLEQALRFDTMCDVHVIVFQMSKLRSKSNLQAPTISIDMASGSVN